MEKSSLINLICKKDHLGTMLPISNEPEFDSDTGEWDLWFAYEDLQDPDRNDDMTHIGFSSKQAAENCIGELVTMRGQKSLQLEKELSL